MSSTRAYSLNLRAYYVYYHRPIFCLCTSFSYLYNSDLTLSRVLGVISRSSVSLQCIHTHAASELDRRLFAFVPVRARVWCRRQFATRKNNRFSGWPLLQVVLSLSCLFLLEAYNWGVSITNQSWYNLEVCSGMNASRRRRVKARIPKNMLSFNHVHNTP